MNISKEHIRSVIREIVQNTCVNYTSHCSKRMSERGVHDFDFLQVLHWGDIVKATWSNDYECYECEIVGEDLEGDELKIMVAVDEKNYSVRCITVIG